MVATKMRGGLSRERGQQEEEEEEVAQRGFAVDPLRYFSRFLKF